MPVSRQAQKQNSGTVPLTQRKLLSFNGYLENLETSTVSYGTLRRDNYDPSVSRTVRELGIGF